MCALVNACSSRGVCRVGTRQGVFGHAFYGRVAVHRAASEPMLIESGGVSCGPWVAEPVAGGVGTGRPACVVYGFLSGMSLANDVDVLGPQAVDADAIDVWMDNYCRAKPLNQISTGARQLYRELAACVPRTK